MSIVVKTVVHLSVDDTVVEMPSQEVAERVDSVSKRIRKLVEMDTKTAVKLVKLLTEELSGDAPVGIAAKPAPRKPRTPAATKPPAEPAKKVTAPSAPKAPANTSDADGKIKRNVLPNPPGFARVPDPDTGNPPRGRATNEEKIAFASANAEDPETQKWAKTNKVSLSDAPAAPAKKATKKVATKTAKPAPTAAPAPAAKTPPPPPAAMAATPPPPPARNTPAGRIPPPPPPPVG